jgi:hypothetical protein
LRPQLKRDPLGRTQPEHLVHPHPSRQRNLASTDALLSLASPILRGLLLLASIDASTYAVVQHSVVAFIARFARDAVGAIGIAFAVALTLQQIRTDWRESRHGRRL